MKRPFRRSPICCGLPIFWCTYACEPYKTTGAHMQHTHNQHTEPSQPACTILPSLPPPPLLPTGNVGHAPPPTRGESTALCVLLPARSARQSLPHLQQMLLRHNSRCCARSSGKDDSVCDNAWGSC